VRPLDRAASPAGVDWFVERRASPQGRATEYHLTRAGRQLQRVIDVLGRWGARGAFGDPRRTERADAAASSPPASCPPGVLIEHRGRPEGPSRMDARPSPSPQTGAACRPCRRGG
jgi:hypothetical protein